MVGVLFTVKAILFSYFWYKFGFVYSIIILLAVLYAIDMIIKFALNLESLNGMSYVFWVVKPREKKPTSTGYLILEDYKPEEWRDMFIKKGVDAFPKLRKVVVNILENYYWKEVPKSIAYQNLKIMTDIKLNSLKDICDYSIKEQLKHYNDN